MIGAVALAEKMAQFDAKKFGEMQKASGGGDSGKKAKKEKAEKPKQEQQPKKKKEPTPDPAEEEPALAPVKEKDPFAAMPKGNFDMDDFKRSGINIFHYSEK